MKLFYPGHEDLTQCGGKANSLFSLVKAGFPVPPFVVISGSPVLNNENNIDSWKKSIESMDKSLFPIDTITQKLGDQRWYAVRSSATDEDGNNHSFAGQYESFLYVSKEALVDRIKAVWLSSCNERVIAYREKNGLPLFSPVSVIVQVMVDSETSGVGFGINPITGHRQQRMISAVYGLGEGLVSGELDADHYLVENGRIEKTIAEKTHFFTAAEKGQTIQCAVETNKIHAPALSDTQILEIDSLVQKCSQHFERPQDIEFAFYNGKFYLLQSRPITTLSRIPDISAKRTVWDNSNIIESYPGVTTPLTFSFISASYEGAYRLFLEYLGATAKEISDNKAVFANTLGMINGRVYYNLRSWYQMLAMVPGYSINAGFMEKMMGVKEKFELDHPAKLSKTKAWWRTIKMLGKMYQRYSSLPRKRAAFQELLNNTIDTYKAIDLSSKNPNELMQLYFDFERTLLNEWKAPLLNDFFAMIAFGSLQKKCEQYRLNKKNPNIHNDLLCGSSDIVSVQPIHRTIEMATLVTNDQELKTWFLSMDDEQVWEQLSKGKYPNLYEILNRYINDFGERCVGELKLETISFVQYPPALVQVVRAYVNAGITQHSANPSIEETLRRNAETEVNRVLGNNWIRKIKFRKKVKNARTLVSNRENLRYERTRAFGIVRQIFFHMGKNFHAEGIIEQPRDIFYLAKEEIFAYISGTAVSQDIAGTIALRKKEYAAYQQMPTPAERIETFGMVYHGNDFFSRNKITASEGDLKGIGCCPGTVKAKVTVVTHPQEIQNLEGTILVTTSTDPGWVTLFPSASGIIVERGSLLSHSAIVAREMGIPCIVGVTGLLQRLKTGDTVEMDGNTGQISIIK